MRKHAIAAADSRAASQRQIETAAYAVAAYRGHDRFRRALNLVRHPLSRARKIQCLRSQQGSDLPELRAGAKSLLASGNHRAHTSAGASEPFDLPRKLAQHTPLQA